MGIKAKKLQCVSCDVRFTLYSLVQRRKGYFCPMCGESEGVRRYIDSKSPHHPHYGMGRGALARWTAEDEAALINMYGCTNLSNRDMGKQLGRSLQSISLRLVKLRKEGRIV